MKNIYCIQTNQIFNDMKHRLFNLFIVIVASIASLSASAQSSLTPEETAFLKSLNGKWNPSEESSGRWGHWMYDISFLYVNGKLKLKYTSESITEGNKTSVLETKVKDAYFDQTNQNLIVSYTSSDLDIDNDKSKTYSFSIELTIPMQPDIDNAFYAYRTTYIKASGKTHGEEVIYYKH